MPNKKLEIEFSFTGRAKTMLKLLERFSKMELGDDEKGLFKEMVKADREQNADKYVRIK